MSMPVLATKFFVPARRSEFLTRLRLVELLDAAVAPGRRATLISAPAGFGKTTLVVDWIGHHAQHPSAPRVGWLSLDDRDNDRTRFLTHLVAALHGANPGIGSDALGLLNSASPPAVEATLTALINDLARASGQIVLVLDDYHVLDAPPVHEAVTFLLDHLPPQLHLMITSRADPPLPLARLRARGELIELRAAHLRFTPDETANLLNQVIGLGLSDADVDALETRTEGWVAGLQLAALSMRDRDDVSAFIGAFTGSNRFVLDYLLDEVLHRQPRDVRDFLLQTAVLDRLTGPLCDAVTGRGDGGIMLERLERANLFLIALDERRGWYRYHHLFADALTSRMLGAHPDQVSVLHRLASGWYEDNGQSEDAVRHAMAAGDVDRAAHLMEAALPALRRSRHDATLVGWLNSLPDEVVRRSPVLNVFYGWMLMVSGDLDAVEPRLDDAECALAVMAADSGPVDPPGAENEELRALPVTVALYRAALAQARGDIVGITRHAQRALELAGPGDHFARGGAAGFLGLAAWADGDIERAVATFGQAVQSLHAAGNLTDALGSTVVLGEMWLVAGRPSTARRLYERALSQATALVGDPGVGDPGVGVPRCTADLHVGLSELDRELGDLTAAACHLETAKLLGERAAMTEHRHRWFAAMAEVTEAYGDPDGALDLLDQAERLYRPGFHPDVRPIAAMKARIWIRHGRLVEAADWAHVRDLSATDDLSYLREYEHLTLARLLLAQPGGHGDTTALDRATGLLDRLLQDATRSARAGSVLEIRLLQALVHQAQGHRPLALDALKRAMAEAPEPEGYVRLFLDEAQSVPLLRDAVRHGVGGDHARRLLELGDSTAAAATVWGRPAAHPSADLLTERELQVLRLLDSGLSGPQIAVELFVSRNTLRTHTKHIFTKLDVTSRRAAVLRARERGLI